MGEYLEAIALPISRGVRAAGSGNVVVGPEVALSACGIPSGCSGLDQWITANRFVSVFDILSVHAYRGSHGDVAADLDAVHLAAPGAAVWLTESGFSANQASEVRGLYVDNYNRSGWWARTFYHGLIGNGATDLLNLDWSARPGFAAFRDAY